MRAFAPKRIRDNGKDNGNYYDILGQYWDNGKENGNYYSIGLYRNSLRLQGLYCVTSRLNTHSVDSGLV